MKIRMMIALPPPWKTPLPGRRAFVESRYCTFLLRLTRMEYGREVLINSAETYGVTPESISEGHVLAGGERIIEANCELNCCFISKCTLHSDHVVDVPCNRLGLHVGVTRTQYNTPYVLRKQLEKLGKSICWHDRRVTGVVLEYKPIVARTVPRKVNDVGGKIE